MKNIIGKELITDANTAIFELVKNSYDANANKVTIIFEKIWRPEKLKDKKVDTMTEEEEEIEKKRKSQSKITIIDDGDGMSLEGIRKKWLFAGYSEKKIDEDKDKKEIEKEFKEKIGKNERIFAGAKGIGRFSADRLGSNLIMYTKKENQNTIHKLKINWGDFKDQEKEFQNITADYSTVKNLPIEHPTLENFEKGTILEIFPITDDWDRRKIVKLNQFLRRLIHPNQISGVKNFKIIMDVKEFGGGDYKLKYARKKIDEKYSGKTLKNNKVFEKDTKELKKIEKEFIEIINGEIKNIVFEKLGIKTTQIHCIIKEDKITTTIIDKGIFIFEIEEENTFEPLKDINIHIFYLNKAAKIEFTKTMGMPPFKFGSIFMYKNGFRIQPFGDVKDDWLDLEADKGQGYGRNLSRREVIGRIEINGPQTGFKEVTSRDRGVVITHEYEQLVYLVKRKVLKWLTRYVVEGIDWDKPEDKKTKSKEDVSKDSLDLIAKFTGQIEDPNKKISFNSDLLKIIQEKQLADLPEITKNIEKLLSFVKSKEIQERMTKYVKQYNNITKTYAEEIKKSKQKLAIKEKETLFLKKSLSTDMQLIEDYNHWIDIGTGKIQTYLKNIVKAIHDKQEPISLLPLIEKISIENQRISMVASIMSQANFNIQAKEKIADIAAYITQYIKNIISGWTQRIKIRIINEHLIFKTKFIPLEISIMMDNFVTNSRKAGATNITIKFTAKNKKLQMLIADDGKGIPGKDVPYIFDRAFTRTNGSGIGLNHIQSIGKRMRGSVKFLQNDFEGIGKGACFEVIFE